MSETQTDFQDIELYGRNGVKHRFRGVLLGYGTSHRVDHDHPPGEGFTKGQSGGRGGTRCSACRWYTAAIYLNADDTYVVHTVGDTTVPGEVRLSRIVETPSAFEIVELLTVRRPGKTSYLPTQALRALAQAADVDEAVRDAYINRAVV